MDSSNSNSKPIAQQLATFDPTTADIAPDYSRAEMFLQSMDIAQDTITSGARTYKEGAFKSSISLTTPVAAAVDIYTKSALVSAAEKQVFQRALSCFAEAKDKYVRGESVISIRNKMAEDFSKPLVEIFKADMLTRGAYVPQCRSANTLCSMGAAEGKVTFREYSKLLNHPRQDLCHLQTFRKNPLVARKHKAKRGNHKEERDAKAGMPAKEQEQIEETATEEAAEAGKASDEERSAQSNVVVCEAGADLKLQRLEVMEDCSVRGDRE